MGGFRSRKGLNILFYIAVGATSRKMSTSAKPIEILLIEDDSQSADLVVTAAEMASANFTFYFAANGLEGMDFLLRRNSFETAPIPDLVLLDLNLPIMSGQEILGEMKRNPRLKNMPVVLL